MRSGSLAVLVVAVSVDVVLLVVGSEVAGIRQRLLVAAGCLWQLLVLKTVPSRSASQ